MCASTLTIVPPGSSTWKQFGRTCWKMAGDQAAARVSYRTAARRTTSLPEQRYLEARAAPARDDR